MKHIPLKAAVEGDCLIIRIGSETLAWASNPKNGGKLEGCKVDLKRTAEFAKDVATEMQREDELGNSPLNEFLDEMMQAAADNGSAALIFPKRKR